MIDKIIEGDFYFYSFRAVLLNFAKSVKQKSKRNYIHTILLNEKIISKFAEEYQTKLWEVILSLFDSEENIKRMKNFLNMTKICLFLRFYDQKRYSHFCCKEHSEIFKINSSDSTQMAAKQIMFPEMNAKIEKLMCIVQKMIDQGEYSQIDVNLFKLLCFDLSPCLQKYIILIYYRHFTNDRISDERKNKTLFYLLGANCLEIALFVLSVSVMDVRIEAFKLIILIFTKFFRVVQGYFQKPDNKQQQFTEKFKAYMKFLAENALPRFLFVDFGMNEAERKTFKKLMKRVSLEVPAVKNLLE